MSRGSAALSLLTLALLFAPLAARAGYYDGPVYTSADGKVVTTSSYYSGFTERYLQSGGSFGGSNQSPSCGDALGNPTNSTITCSGSITATFTWNNGGDPNDKPPQSAVVTENCQTYWTGPNYQNVYYSGSCTNPLGGSPTAGPSGVGQTWDFIKYRVVSNPGASFTVSCSPSVNASAGGTVGYVSAGVTYSASLSPVTIDLQGVTLDANNRNPQVLTGQQVDATLNTGRFSVVPRSTNWAVTGDAFKNYDYTSTSNQLVPLSAPDFAVDIFAFYTKKNEPITLTCNATVTTNTNPATTLAVTATKTFASVKPTATWGIAGGIVQQKNSVVGLYGLGILYTDGQSWHDVNINVPAPFSGGQFCFAQLVTPDLKIYRNLPRGSTASSY